MNVMLTREESFKLNQIIKDHYLELGPKRIAEMVSVEFGKSVKPNTVRMRSFNLGIVSDQMRVMKANRENMRHDYFSDLNSISSYDLGFVFADGSIAKTMVDLEFCLSRCDREYLEGFKERIRCENVIQDYFYISKSGKEIPCSKFSVRSKKMVDDLTQKWGLVNRKTHYDVPFPTISDELSIPFIRGLVDGDGSAFRIDFEGGNQSPRFSFRVRGTFKVTSGSVERICRMSGAVVPEVALEFTTQEGMGLYSATWTSPYDISRVYPLMYPDDDKTYPCFHRKRLVLEDGVEFYALNPTTASHNTTGYVGVQNSGDGLFLAVLQRNTLNGSRPIYLGKYESKEEAAYAYNSAAAGIRGGRARLNLIELGLDSDTMKGIDEYVARQIKAWEYRFLLGADLTRKGEDLHATGLDIAPCAGNSA